MQSVYASITLVCDAQIISRKAGFRAFEQAEVVRPASAERCRYYLFTPHYYLTFY